MLERPDTHAGRAAALREVEQRTRWLAEAGLVLSQRLSPVEAALLCGWRGLDPHTQSRVIALDDDALVVVHRQFGVRYAWVGQIPAERDALGPPHVDSR